MIVGDIIPKISNEADAGHVAERASSMFETAELKAAAVFAAGVHIRAIDYLVQAPALAILVQAGGGRLNGGFKNKAYAAHKFGGLCDRGARLNQVLRAYGCSLPLRKLHAKALSLDHEKVLPLLGALNPSTLSQIIPKSVSAQRHWLSALAAWVNNMVYSGTRLRDHCFEWAAMVFAEARVKAREANDVSDFARLGDKPFNPSWTWIRAQQETQDWHDRLSAGDASKRFGVLADQPVCQGKHPDHVVVGDFEFVALRTPIAIHAEGQYMRHCVSSYVPAVVDGHCSIVSIQRDEKRLATLEILYPLRMRQLKGRFNAPVPASIRQAAQFYMSQLAESQAREPSA